MPFSSLWLVELIGWTGVILYVIAYYMVSAGKVGGQSTLYQLMNLAGACGVALNAFYYTAYPSTMVNVIWFGIAGATLMGLFATNEARPAPAEPRRPHRRFRLPQMFLFLGSLLAVLGVVLVVLAVAPRPPHPARPIRVYTSNWQPYIGRDLPSQGPLSGLVREIFQKAGYQPMIEFVGFDVAMNAVEASEAMSAFPYVKNPERQKRFLYSEPLLSFNYVFFHRDDGSVNQRQLNAWLAGRNGSPNWRVGVVPGYELWSRLNEQSDNATVYPTTQAAFEALARGEVDLVPESRLRGRQVLYQPDVAIDSAKLTSTAITFEDQAELSSRRSLHIIAPRTPVGQAMIDQINAQIADLKADGTLEILQDRFDAAAEVSGPLTHVRINQISEATDDQGRKYRLADGVRAVVLDWPAGFADPINPSAESDPFSAAPFCRIKIATGPLRGRVLTVRPNSFVVIDEPTAKPSVKGFP